MNDIHILKKVYMDVAGKKPTIASYRAAIEEVLGTVGLDSSCLISGKIESKNLSRSKRYYTWVQGLCLELGVLAGPGRKVVMTWRRPVIAYGGTQGAADRRIFEGLMKPYKIFRCPSGVGKDDVEGVKLLLIGHKISGRPVELQGVTSQIHFVPA